MPPLRILLVDDDPGFRHLFGLLLQRHGYKVLLASGSVAALELAEEADVAIVDITMPDVNGIKAIPLLRQRNPALKTIASSGSAEEKFRADLDLIGGVPFLAKPFTMQSLGDIIKVLYPAEVSA
jgi:CheY-like chemotaxis protein